MSHFRLHTMKEREYLKYLIFGLVCLIAAVMTGYVIHSIGTARAKSQETVLIFTEEEFIQYLVDQKSEEYDLNGRYRLEENLDLSGLEHSIGSNLEPFTGKLDGNGHVITGLNRPLFGVMKKAEARDLFFSDVMIRNPFTYSDGTHYVDGYGTLAAYAVDSVIENCGMNGEIYTASPAEAEFLTGKASPSEAEEENEPGADESQVESSPVLKEESEGPDGGNHSGAAGPGVEPDSGGDHSVNDAEKNTTEIGPGIESTGDSGTEEIKESESSAQENSSDAVTPTVDESGNDIETSTSIAETETIPSSDGSEDGGVEKPSDGDHATGGEEPTRESSQGGTESSTDSSSEKAEPSTDDSKDDSIMEELDTKAAEETGEAASEAQIEVPKDTADIVPSDPLSETIGFRPYNRPHLMMKAPEAVASMWDDPMPASPADATPADAKEETEGIGPGIEDSGDPTDSESGGPGATGDLEGTDVQDSLETSINMVDSDGNIYILVTAERITAGGLIAETAGETLISGSFTLATIGSRQKEIETYTGGLAGILGAESRTENSYASGLSDGSGVTGGFAAVNQGTIENSYSAVTVGESGSRRGAFTALESGRLNGCIYDRQVACAGEGETSGETWEAGIPSEAVELEFGLMGMSTSELIGSDSQVPGTWRKTENAYPQLEYFAFHEDEAASSTSKASAIALLLPKELTLADVVKNGDIVLPSEIDGETVIWEAEGNIKIDENHQVVSDETVQQLSDTPSIESHDVPNVGSALEPMAIATDSSAMELEPVITETAQWRPEETSGSNRTQLKASIGNVSRNFTISAVAASARAVYADWGAVGEAIYNRTETGTDFVPALNAEGYYEIKTPEALAWFAYMVNSVTGQTGIKGKLMNDIDLNGTVNNWTTAGPLQWKSIGFASTTAYTGTFDGGTHTILNLKIDDTTAGGNRGFFGYINSAALKDIILSQVDVKAESAAGVVANAAGSFVISGCGLESGVVAGGSNSGGIICRGGAGKVRRCYNKAQITISINSKSKVAGGIVGRSDWASINISECYNWGEVGVPRMPDCHAAGILPYSRGKSTMDSCYNVGKISEGSDYRGGGIGAQVSITLGKSVITNCYNIEGIGRQVENNGGQIPEKVMRTWGAAYALNGFKLDGAWTFDPNGENYPTWGTLPPARDWRDIGQMQYCRSDIVPLPNGTGTKEDPYLLATAEQLATFEAEVDWGSTNIHGVLTDNINLAGKAEYGGYDQANPLPWRPIGDENHVFSGSLNGKGKSISYMNVQFRDYAGLFGVAGNGAEIQGIGLEPTCRVGVVSDSGGRDGTAAFVGAVQSDGTSRTQIVIKGCYNRGSVTGRNGATTGAFVGTHLGSAGVGGQRITNCYTTGHMSTVNGEQPGAIAGSFVSNPNDQSSGIRYCYWDSGTSGSVAGAVSDSSSVVVRDTQAKSTVNMTVENEILTLLNTELKSGSWTRTLGTNNNYPVYSEASSVMYTDWEDVGKYHLSPPYRDAGMSSTSGTERNPFQIATPEDLAWFAYQVNHGDTDICGELTADISLFGGTYSGRDYTEGDPRMKDMAFPWIPAGNGSDVINDTDVYIGKFFGNGHMVSLMNVHGTGAQGLFGTVSKFGEIQDVGIENSSIIGQEAGGIAGRLVRDAQVNRCFVRGGIEIRTNGTANDQAGGIAGGACGMSKIQDCYMMDAHITASGTGNMAGGIVGGMTLGPEVNSCYSQTTTGGTIEGTQRGAIVGGGLENTSGGLSVNQCYSDAGFPGDVADSEKLVIGESNENTQMTVNTLNIRSQVERTGTDRAWYTSLLSEPTKGYPTLAAPRIIDVTISPAEASGGRKVTLPTEVNGAYFRGIRQEYGEGHPVFTLKPGTEVSGAFAAYGTDSANEKLGLVAGTDQDLAGLNDTTADRDTLTEPTVSAGNINALTLYNGAAYTYGKSRVIITDVAAGGVRYEIRATIPGAVEKTLNVVLPVKVEIEDLTPDGTLKKSYSADLALTNQNDYPITGKVFRLVSMTGENYVILKPVAKNDPYGDKKQLSDSAGGVKIGIGDTSTGAGIVPAAGIYYTPAKTNVNPPVEEKWMEYQIKGKGVLPYRYFLEYTANPHYSDTNQYGYTVNYQFGISKTDVPDGVEAVVKSQP